MSEVLVSEAEVKALLGPAWSPKQSMVATATHIYTRRGAEWFKVTSPSTPTPSTHRELENPQAEREFWERDRAVHEGGDT